MKRLFILFCIVLTFCISSVAFAATIGESQKCETNGIYSYTTCYTPLAPITDPFGKDVNTKEFPAFLQQIYKIGIGACFALGVIMMVINGIEYIVSESIFTKKGSLDRIQHALIGLAIALASYLLLNTINPDLLIFKDIQAFKSTPTTGTTNTTTQK